MNRMLRLIIQEITNAKNLSNALNSMTQKVAEIINAEACSVFIVDSKREDYMLLATTGLPKKYIHKLHLDLSDGLVGLVGKRRVPVNIADTLAHPKFCHYDMKTKKPYRAFLGVPIIQKKKLLGVLTVQKNESHNFDENAEALLLTLAIHVAEIIAFAKASSDAIELPKEVGNCIFQGVQVVNGIGIGKAVVVPANVNYKVACDDCQDFEHEIAAFKKALEKVCQEINALQQNWATKTNNVEYDLLNSYIEILTSKDLTDVVIQEVNKGNSASIAVERAFQKWSLSLQKVDNTYLRERSEDILNLGRRILAHLQSSAFNNINYPMQTILVGENITIPDFIEVPIEKLAGIISLHGTHVSHSAILARSLNIPTIMGIKNCVLEQLKDQEIIIDGYHGQIYVSPVKKLLQKFSNLAAQEQKLYTELNELRDLPAKTKDGYFVSLLLNADLPTEIDYAIKVGIQGIGLYRTEIAFMNKDYFPTENEQYLVYRDILQQAAPRKVVMRTLDAGGDKQLPYLEIKETNPSLGWRGIRVTLDHPEILLMQVRAMLRANQDFKNLHILLPMVSDVSEVKQALSLIKQAYDELLMESVIISELPKVGVMIEIPAAIYQIKELARLVDFFSVGSNDLTQYLLAVDRQNERVADIYDTLHPAVLKALAQIVELVHEEHKTVSICGEIAGDPLAAILLMALGFDSLSMNASQLLKVKWSIRSFTMEAAKKILSEVMQMDNQKAIRNYLQSVIKFIG